MVGFRSYLGRLWREARCISPDEASGRDRGLLEGEARVILHARSEDALQKRSEEGVQAAARPDSSLYSRFWELHRRLSSTGSPRHKHRRSSEGDATTNLDDKSDVSDGGQDEDAVCEDVQQKQQASPERLLDVFDPEDHLARLQVLAAVDALRGRFKQCSLAHLVVASFLVRAPMRLARRCLHPSVGIHVQEAQRVATDLALALALGSSSWNTQICLHHVTVADGVDAQRVLELMWHDARLLGALDAYLLRKERRVVQRRAFARQMALLSARRLLCVRPRRTRHRNAYLRSLIE